MRKPEILDSDGKTKDAPSEHCPECFTDFIEKLPMGGQDFDENGWFHVQPYRCLNPKCNHAWSERIVLIPGKAGTLIKHG